MPKFIKGVYAFTNEEIDELINSRNSGQSVEINGKSYVPFYIKRKSGDIDDEEFRVAITTYHTKKAVCEALKTTYFKYQKYCESKFQTDSIEAIRNFLTK